MSCPSSPSLSTVCQLTPRLSAPPGSRCVDETAHRVITWRRHVKPILLSGSAVGATAVSMVMFATGIAAADDYAGKTYADASSALSGASLKGVIAGRVGETLPTDQCVVTHSEKALWIKGDKFAGDERFDAV